MQRSVLEHHPGAGVLNSRHRLPARDGAEEHFPLPEARARAKHGAMEIKRSNAYTNCLGVREIGAS